MVLTRRVFAAQELSELLGEEKLAGVPVMIFANKQDLDSAQSQDQVSALSWRAGLGNSLALCPPLIMPCCGLPRSRTRST